MPSSGRHILDIKRKGPSRAKARGQMAPLFKEKAPEPRMSRPQRLRQRRRNKRLIIAGISMLVALVFFGALAGATHLEQLAIRDVSIVGAEHLPPDSVASAAREQITDEGFQLFSRENMFLYPKRAIEQSLALRFPRIKGVSVGRETLLAQAVVVTIEERQPYASWCEGDGCYVMDAKGFIYAEGSESETGYTFQGGLISGVEPIGQWFLRGRLPETIAVLDAVSRAGFQTDGASVDTEKDFTVSLLDGPDLQVSFAMSPEDIVLKLGRVLDEGELWERFRGFQYMDLRFGNRVYYK